MIKVNFNGNWKLYLSYQTSYTQSISKNQTTVKTKVYIGSVKHWDINYRNVNKNVYITIGGVQKSLLIDSLNLNGNTKYLGEVTHVINHSSDGTCSTSLKISCDMQNITVVSSISGNRLRVGSINYSKSLSFPTIARKSKINLSKYSYNLGERINLNCNYKSDSFNHKWIIKYGNTELKSYKVKNNNYTTMLDYMGSELARYGKNRAYITLSIYLYTYNGSTYIQL